MSITKPEKFQRDGFVHFESVLDSAMVRRLRDTTDEILALQESSHFEQQKSTGSMVLIDWQVAYDHDVMAELVAHPTTLAALSELGYDAPKFGHGRLISKPPKSPRLFWHEDGRFWDDPVSYTTQPIQVFLMYYLVDTSPQNGCLRVLPGSHLKRHRLHDEIAERHTPELRQFKNPDGQGFSRVEGEVDVPVKAGDLVVGYATLLHAAHSNGSNQRRTVLTMWYYPDYPALPAQTQAAVAMAEAQNCVTTTEPGEVQAPMEPLRIEYFGTAEPIPQNLAPVGLK